MYNLEFTNQYLKDLKLARKRQFSDKNRITNIIIYT